MDYRLCDPDRERFGCAEWLPFSVYAISLIDLEELSERFSFDPSEWPTPYFGELTLEQAGNPEAKPVPPRWQMRACAWQILRQNGYDVSWEDAGTVRIWMVTVRRDDGGKDPEPSPGSAPSTTRRSRSSSGSRKRTSTS